MGLSSSPARWAKRRAFRMCDPADAEGENLKKWKERFIEEEDSFEEYSMEVNAFGMDDWSD